MVAHPYQGEGSPDLLLSYSIGGDERVYEAIISAFVAVGVDVERRDTVLRDWIEPDIVDVPTWETEPGTYLSTEIWEHPVVVSPEKVWIYEQGTAKADALQ